MTDHIPDAGKKVLNTEQIRFMAEMYAEQEGIKEFEVLDDPSFGPIITWKPCSRTKFKQLLDRNICMGVLEKWAKGPCESYNLYYSGGVYTLSLMRDTGELEPYTVERRDPFLPIAIASGLVQIKE